MTERDFPVLLSYRDQRQHPDWPSSVPWSLVAPHEKQALRNHCGQTLERLAQRGGLDPRELWHILNDRKWTTAEMFGGRNEARMNEAVEFLRTAIANHATG